MAFRASSSRLNTQRQHSGSLRDFVEDGSQLAALPVQRRRTSQGRLKRAGSLGKFEKKGHYEACGTVKLLLAAAQTADVTHLEQALLAEVGRTSASDWPGLLFHPCNSLVSKHLQGYDVVLAQDAQGVLEAVKTSPHPDLVLMNYTLPGLTGSQVSTQVVCDTLLHLQVGSYDVVVDRLSEPSGACILTCRFLQCPNQETAQQQPSSRICLVEQCRTG